ncbi:MAG: hypothetical protein IT270_17005 [Saprospiraceae bacterium]|nr:hypothetical protein [Saprospiraceae bacterium]
MRKSIYLAGWQVRLNGDQQCENFVATQITTKETAKSIYVAMELVYKNGVLVKAFEYEEGEKQERDLHPDEVGFPMPVYEPNRILKLVEKPKGRHQLGGELPHDVQFPENNCVVPFQYLGFINNNDPQFHWLPFKVHLMCPIYLNIDVVYLDYNDSQHPKLLNREEIENTGTSYDDLNQHSEIVFEALNFDFVQGLEFADNGNAGIPSWIQHPTIPTCPISGKRMKFLCQFSGGVRVKRTNVVPKNENYRRYFEELDFWGGGYLYVFFEPTSKVACYFIQNT